MAFYKSRYVRRRSVKAPMRRKTVRRIRRAIRRIPKTSLTPFPPFYLTRLRYGSQGKSLAVSAGSFATHEYSANSLYDPDVTGTGHQPRFFDSLCGSNNGTAPYHDYLVYGCKAIITFNNYSGAIGGQVIVGYRDASISAPASAEECLERANYKVKDIAYYQGGPTVRPISIYIPINRVYGISKRGMMDDPGSFGSVYNNNPSNFVKIDVGYQASATSTSTIGFNVKLIYYVKFYNRNDVADS